LVIRRSAALRPLAVAALIEAGADSNAENRRGATALHYACDARPKAGKTWNPSAQRSVIERLLDAGSDIEHKDKAGATPLHRAVRARSRSSREGRERQPPADVSSTSPQSRGSSRQAQ